MPRPTHNVECTLSNVQLGLEASKRSALNTRAGVFVCSSSSTTSSEYYNKETEEAMLDGGCKTVIGEESNSSYISFYVFMSSFTLALFTNIQDAKNYSVWHALEFTSTLREQTSDKRINTRCTNNSKEKPLKKLLVRTLVTIIQFTEVFVKVSILEKSLHSPPLVSTIGTKICMYVLDKCLF